MGAVTVVEVPQWRGSGAATAERLVEGAWLLSGMVPAERRVRVEAGDDLVVTAARVREALTAAGDGFVVTVGGDCGVELEPVAAARRAYGDRLVVVWFDAHGDLNTPQSSPSGAFHGMVLRALTGEGPRGLTADPAVDPRRVVLAGARDLDPGEAAFVAAAGVGHVRAADPEALIRAVTAASPPEPAGEVVLYVHVDLDVLEPEVFGSVGSPVAGGFSPEELTRMVTALGERFAVAGLGITEYEPGRPGDRDVLAPVVTALVEACTSHPGRTAPR
ncbi:arginase family protein [Nonomuraea sp. MCN248]|uniref:Arginase family protein n=1 Tax=Nonomuraea corallina TaxID=2989783 RepID=A0ABT4S473_9ACTN|nr:arginase family protein [Nonomuraea corallina]MDA0631984.1 arginase family protein [Nonomuraea corallina]